MKLISSPSGSPVATLLLAGAALLLDHASAATLSIYLPLDGNTSSGTGTSVSGTAIGANAATPTYVGGVFGQAGSFNNNASSGTTPSDWAVSIGNQDSMYAGDFSVSFWAKTTSAADAAILGNSNWTSGNNTGWLVSTLGGGREGKVKTDTGTRQNEAINFKDGNWHMISLVVDNANDLAFWYLDGTLLNGSGDAIGSGTLAAGFNTLIGSSGNGAYSGAAAIDDVGIFTGQLTTQEISNLWNGGTGRTANLFTVPEPSSTTLLGGLVALGLLRRRRD